MLDSIKMMKLDWLAIKGYTKQALLSYLMLTVILVTTLPYALNIIYFVCASSFVGYPFMVAEQNGMDKFYKMVATTKKARVGSKYLATILGLVVMITVLIPINCIIYATVEERPSFALLIGMLLIGILFYCIVVSIQIPACFKWGYAKSKVISMMMPMVIGFGVPVTFYILIKFMPKEEVYLMIKQLSIVLENSTVELLIGTLLFGTLTLGLSYKVSMKVCR